MFLTQKSTTFTGWMEKERKWKNPSKCVYHHLNGNIKYIRKCIWMKFWINSLIPKIAYFLWMVVLKIINTNDVMKRKWLSFPNRYTLCMKDEETYSHLFLHYDYFFELWEEVNRRIKHHWVRPYSLDETIEQWIVRSQKSKIIWALFHPSMLDIMKIKEW